MLRRCRSIVLMTALFLSAPLFAASYSQLVVIGDSLSDTGNLYDLTASLPPFLGIPATPPSPPYSNGRFSNGPVYTDYLNQKLGLSPTPELSPSRAGGTNHAYGNALVSGTASGIIPSLPAQSATLLASAGGSLDPNALYVVWGGNNDLFGLLDQSLSSSMAQPLIEGVADLLLGTIASLVSSGAQHLLVPNIPDLGMTPREAGNAASATQYSQWFNSRLGDGLASIPADIVLFDTFATLREAPTVFANATGMCILLSSCDGYLFFDDVHPTTAAQQILADRMYAQLTAVPLPAGVWLFGSALTLLLVRRRG